MTTSEVATFGAALIGGGTLTAIINSLLTRKKLGADATAVVTAAARELVDPLRKELAIERSEHVKEIEVERRKVGEVRDELRYATEEVRELRKELTLARLEMNALRLENETHKQRIRDLEAR